MINDDDEDFDNDLAAPGKKAQNKAEADKLVISDSTEYKEVPEDADGGDGEEKKKSSCCFFIDIFHTYNTGFLVALGLQYFNAGTQVIMQVALLSLFKDTFGL